MAKLDIEYVWTDKKRTIFGLPISFTRYILTEKKFITRTGLLSINEDEVELYRVADKSLHISFGQRLFRCGTVTINCRDVDTPVKTVKSIKNPRQFMETLEKYVDIQRDRYRVRGRDMIGAVFAGSDGGDYDVDYGGTEN